MKIFVGQMNPIIGDIEGNKEKILDIYYEGIDAGADIVVCPELALLGYPPLDLVEKKGFRNTVHKAAKELAAATGGVGLLFGSIDEDDDAIGTNLYNSAILCHDGEIKFIQHKTLIPNYDVFDEMRYFEPSKSVSIYEFKGEKLGISICEDIWNDKDFWKHRLYLNDPVERLMQQGATVLINISASPYSFGKREERRQMLRALCNKGSLPLAYVCCAATQTDLIFDGASLCFDSKGRLVKTGKVFAEDAFMFDTKEEYEEIVSIERSFEEEIHDALIFGIKEYFVKMRFKKALLGLSGGIDSAIVAYFAAQALGAENVHVILLPSKYSSDGSIGDSIKLIKNLGISHAQISIQPAVDELINSVSAQFGNRKEDTTEENIQSRVRGVTLMAIANKLGYMLLTTGNKSELATGYCTLYGDMCGGLAVIADVYKTDIYRVSNYINRDKEIIPHEIIEKAPSAELRPNQTDQDSLPPYPVLDKILRAYLEENKEYDEIVAEVPEPETVKRMLRLVDMNEFKRKQAAPALRVSYKAFGYGRRYPIVQGWRR